MIVNPLEPLIGYQLRRASTASMTTLARELAAFGVSVTEGSILLLIAANPGITQSEIGRVLAIKRANMAPLAAGLASRGLVERKRVDGRSHGLVLSIAGGPATAAIGAAMRDHDVDLLRSLSAAAQGALAASLARIQHDLAQASGSPT